MRVISDKDKKTLLRVSPYQFAVVGIEEGVIEIKSRIVPCRNGNDTTPALIEYKDRKKTWNEFLAFSKSNLWRYLNASEENAVIQDVITENISVLFMTETEGYRAFALTEAEFFETVPSLKEGTYILYITKIKEG